MHYKDKAVRVFTHMEQQTEGFTLKAKQIKSNCPQLNTVINAVYTAITSVLGNSLSRWSDIIVSGCYSMSHDRGYIYTRLLGFVPD